MAVRHNVASQTSQQFPARRLAVLQLFSTHLLCCRVVTIHLLSSEPVTKTRRLLAGPKFRHLSAAPQSRQNNAISAAWHDVAAP